MTLIDLVNNSHHVVVGFNRRHCELSHLALHPPTQQPAVPMTARLRLPKLRSSGSQTSCYACAMNRQLWRLLAVGGLIWRPALSPQLEVKFYTFHTRNAISNVNYTWQSIILFIGLCCDEVQSELVWKESKRIRSEHYYNEPIKLSILHCGYHFHSYVTLYLSHLISSFNRCI